jgi:hypothetical protein
MSTHDYIVDNQNGANFRSDLNNALAAIVSNNSSATAPTTTYAFMLWADTANDLLKQRNGADSAWVDILTLSTGAVSNAEVADNAITLAKMAHGTDGEIITYDASGAPATVGVGTSGQVLTSNGAGSAPSMQDSAAGGKVLQVVSTTKTDAFSSSGVSWSDITGLSVSITPSSTSSTILVTACLSLDSSDTNLVGGRIMRDSTPIAVSTVTGSQFEGAFSRVAGGYSAETQSLTHEDSPATTSAVTYKIQLNGYSSGTHYVNRPSSLATNRSTSVSSITVMEIGA